MAIREAHEEARLPDGDSLAILRQRSQLGLLHEGSNRCRDRDDIQLGLQMELGSKEKNWLFDKSTPQEEMTQIHVDEGKPSALYDSRGLDKLVRCSAQMCSQGALS